MRVELEEARKTLEGCSVRGGKRKWCKNLGMYGAALRDAVAEWFVRVAALRAAVRSSSGRLKFGSPLAPHVRRGCRRGRIFSTSS